MGSSVLHSFGFVSIQRIIVEPQIVASALIGSRPSPLHTLAAGVVTSSEK